ncbi:MAG: AAA family ATPase [Firmicutes bacterium HGW-Firmicutes-14]|jgi:MoxR-like ATPase|nr:MAG: AAA family ATPase [Firmicutes bacterium HGW-Firmicutes-14]
MKRIQELAAKLRENIQAVIVGKSNVVELILISLLCQGHMLLEDVPGMGKTMLVRTLAKSLGCSFKRIQFTPDLLPSDILGVSIFNQKTHEFEFRAGPVMAQIVLADEINRTSPRTQASLLECMEEEQITVDGVTYKLPRPFMILATQNPIEYEGTFPLPEAQMDRFLIKAHLGYPTYNEEIEILERLEKKHPIGIIEQAFDITDLLDLQEKVAEIHIDDSLKDYIVKIVQGTRSYPGVALGASPRGSLALMKTGKAKAGLNGRDYVIPDDIKALALPTLAHRIVLKPETHLKGKKAEEIIEEVLGQVPLDV